MARKGIGAYHKVAIDWGGWLTQTKSLRKSNLNARFYNSKCLSRGTIKDMFGTNEERKFEKLPG